MYIHVHFTPGMRYFYDMKKPGRFCCPVCFLSDLKDKIMFFTNLTTQDRFLTDSTIMDDMQKKEKYIFSWTKSNPPLQLGSSNHYSTQTNFGYPWLLLGETDTHSTTPNSFKPFLTFPSPECAPGVAAEPFGPSANIKFCEFFHLR